jgi:uroporphyrinogen-III decarboxylase
MDKYYMDYSYQRKVQAEARDVVNSQLNLNLIRDFVIDTGVVLNASLFGGKPNYHSNSTPVLVPVINDPSDVAALAKRIDSLSDEALMHEGILQKHHWEAAEFWKNSEGRPLQAPASEGTKGIATVCGQLCGVTNFLMWLILNPEEMKELTSLVGRTFKRYIGACRGFEGKEDLNQLSFASDVSGLMSPEFYDEFCAPHEKDLYEEFAPTGIRYYHSDSNMKQHVGILDKIGVTDVNIGPIISVAEINSQVPAMRIHGQVPPVRVLWQGSTDLVVDSVRQDINDMTSSGADLSQLVVCTAGSVNPGTPLENIEAMLWAAMEFGLLKGNVKESLSSIPVDFDRKEHVNQIS